MKPLIFIILLALFPSRSFAQKKKIGLDQLLFEKGVTLQNLVDETLDQYTEDIDARDSSTIEYAENIKEAIWDEALDNYKELITTYPKSTFLYRALNNKGLIEYKRESYDKAKTTFLTILTSNANDMEKGGVGSGIMAEPYANYKNRAAKMLAHIYLKEKNYTDALRFVDSAKKYKYMHFCGNEYAADKMYMCELYAKCYLGMNNDAKACEILLPNILGNGLADNSEIVELAYNTLIKTHTKSELKTLFDSAARNYHKETVKHGKETEDVYYITFLNTQIQVIDWGLYGVPADKISEKIISRCNKSPFYNKLDD